VIAVARKLAVLLHRLWITGEVYEPLRNSEQPMAA
jgi:transposase